MAIPSGLSAQLGLAEETVYGTPVTVTRFYEFTDESMAMTIARLESAGLRAGTRVLRSDRWCADNKTVGGDINMEVATVGYGVWLKHMFGGVATTNPGVLAYLHTFTPADLPTGGLTVQIGKPDNAGVVQPFTYNGARVASWTMNAAVGEIASLGVTLAALDEVTTTSLETATYPASDFDLFQCASIDLKIAGVSVDVRSVELTGDNGLKIDRYKLGSDQMEEPAETSMRMYGGTLDAYFEDLTAYNRFVNGTEASLELLFTGATDAIEGGHTFEMNWSLNVRFDGETPTVEGPDELAQSLSFKALDTGTGPGTAIEVEYKTTDATP